MQASTVVKAIAIAALSLTACATSRQGPEPDRQTHWMRSCTDDSECGALSCMCGICTLPCGDRADCELELDRPSICQPGNSPAALEVCRVETEARVCLPACEDDEDDPECVAPPPVRLACDDLMRDDTPAGLTVVATGDIVDFDATADGVFWATPNELVVADSTGADPRTVMALGDTVASLAVDGHSMAWSEQGREGIRLRSLPHGEREPVTLVDAPPAVLDPVVAITLTPSEVIWLGDGKVMRTARSDGATVMLADAQGWFLPEAVAVAPRHVYYITMDNPDHLAVQRVRIDGAAERETLALGMLLGVGAIGDDVYYADVGRTADGTLTGDGRGIRRMGDDDFGSVLAWETSGEPMGMASNGVSLFWIEMEGLTSGAEILETSVWQARAPGHAEPAPIAVGDVLVSRIVAPPGDPRHVYMLGICYAESGEELVGQYLVRLDVR